MSSGFVNAAEIQVGAELLGSNGDILSLEKSETGLEKNPVSEMVLQWLLLGTN